MICDTQIISYGYKGIEEYSLKDKSISAISALEFLEVHNEDLRNPKYVIPLFSKNHYLTSFRTYLAKRNHTFNRVSTDRIVLSFGNEFPSIYYFGIMAITFLINRQNTFLYNDSICLLDKEEKKDLKKKFEYLLDNNITCIPLSKSAINLSFSLLVEYAEHNQLKNNFRNSLNDILILSSSIDSKIPLRTEDNALSRFAIKKYSLNYEVDNNYLTINPVEDKSVDKTDTESKGYINKGWQASFRKYGNDHTK